MHICSYFPHLRSVRSLNLSQCVPIYTREELVSLHISGAVALPQSMSLVATELHYDVNSGGGEFRVHGDSQGVFKMYDLRKCQHIT